MFFHSTHPILLLVQSLDFTFEAQGTSSLEILQDSGLYTESSAEIFSQLVTPLSVQDQRSRLGLECCLHTAVPRKMKDCKTPTAVHSLLIDSYLVAQRWEIGHWCYFSCALVIPMFIKIHNPPFQVMSSHLFHSEWALAGCLSLGHPRPQGETSSQFLLLETCEGSQMNFLSFRFSRWLKSLSPNFLI